MRVLLLLIVWSAFIGGLGFFDGWKGRNAELNALRAEAAQSAALAHDWQTRAEQWRSIALLPFELQGADVLSRPSVQPLPSNP